MSLERALLGLLTMLLLAANLLPGDIILSIDGEAASNGRRSMNQVARTQPGQRIQIEILRDGKLLQLSAEVGVRPTAGEQ